MKLKALTDIRLAKPYIRKDNRPWIFSKDEVIETEDSYLIERLQEKKLASLVKVNEVEKPKVGRPKKQEVEAKKMPPHDNKLLTEIFEENK